MAELVAVERSCRRCPEPWRGCVLPRGFFPSAGDRARPPQAGSVMRAGAKKPHQALAYPLSFFLLGLGFR
jgi:hypothetical protein